MPEKASAKEALQEKKSKDVSVQRNFCFLCFDFASDIELHFPLSVFPLLVLRCLILLLRTIDFLLILTSAVAVTEHAFVAYIT